MSEHRVRIVEDNIYPVWVDRVTNDVIVDWYGEEVVVGKAVFSAEADTWMFEEADGLEDHPTPEGRGNLGNDIEEWLGEKIDVEINENQGEWFNGWHNGVFVGSPSKLLFGADMDGGYDE